MRHDVRNTSELPEVPAGALRIIARAGDTQVMILHGDERHIDDGERLAVIEWFSSIAIAEAVSQECSRLLFAARIPSAHGWHTFPVEHLKKLVQLARNHLNFTYHPSTPEPRERHVWSREKIALFGLLIGQGRTAQAIADDPAIRCSTEMVYQQARRLGLSLQGRPLGQIMMRLPLATLAAYEAAAGRAGLTRDAFIQRKLMDGPSRPDGFAP